jgi:hypothetical protein
LGSLCSQRRGITVEPPESGPARVRLGFGLGIIGISVALGLGGTSCSSDRLPTDVELIESFHKNRGCFEELVKMARAERGLERISSTFVRLSDNFTPSPEQRRSRLSDSRWGVYQSLFQCVHVPDGIGIGSGIYFYAAGIGFAGSGSGKGFLWSTITPTPLVGSLDGTLPYDKDGRVDVFRRLEGDWYLEFDAS